MHDTEAPTTQAERDAAQWRETAGRYLSALEAAERMVAELGSLLRQARDSVTRLDIVDAIDAALASAAEVERRWVSASVAAVIAKRCDAAMAARDEAVARLTRCEMDHVAEIGKVAAAERARDEVGIQLAAAQAEIARMRPVVEAARRLRDADYDDVYVDIDDALRALDAVPGDVLERP